ncbi:MAG: DUF502 domain-containing protein [Nitrospirae bacterium]|nr:MAG: DUF502 domain-containing protein [Nitrospirota bacterium]
MELSPERRMSSTWRRYFFTGVFILVPAWGTFLILSTLFTTLDGLWVELLSPFVKWEMPGVGVVSLLLLILVSGILTTHFVGQWIFLQVEESLDRIPMVRSIYNTLKGMADVFQFRERFGRSAVVIFPFPRDGLWALGFLMGPAPPPLQVVPQTSLVMVFVPTAIHPFTGYLAFVPDAQARRLTLEPQEAMKLEFSAGLYRPPRGWLTNRA